MDLMAEFRRHADECRGMARSTINVEDSAVWGQMAERWVRCAEALEREQSAVTGARPERHRRGRIAGRPQQAA